LLLLGDEGDFWVKEKDSPSKKKEDGIQTIRSTYTIQAKKTKMFADEEREDLERLRIIRRFDDSAKFEKELAALRKVPYFSKEMPFKLRDIDTIAEIYKKNMDDFAWAVKLLQHKEKYAQGTTVAEDGTPITEKGKPLKVIILSKLNYLCDPTIQLITTKDLEEIDQFIKTILLFFYDKSPQKRYLMQYIKKLIRSTLLAKGVDLRKNIEKSTREYMKTKDLREMLPSAKTLNALISQGYTIVTATRARVATIDSTDTKSNDPAVQAWYDKHPLFIEDARGQIAYRESRRLKYGDDVKEGIITKPNYITITGSFRVPMIAVEIYDPEEDVKSIMRKKSR